MDGAAVWLTAAAVPSRTREFDVTRFRSKAGDGYEQDGCSDGRNSVDDGGRGG